MPAARPALPAAPWAATRGPLHRWLQLVGKTQLALSSLLNQGWPVALAVMPRSLSSGPLPYAGGQCELVFE